MSIDENLLRVRLTNRFANFEQPYPEAIREILSYKQPNAFFSPRYKLGLWDGTICLVKYNKCPSGLFLEMLPEIQKQLSVEIDDQRTRPKFQKAELIEREYQDECVTALVKHSNAGGLVLCATGVGKTYMAGLYCKRIIGSVCFVVDELTLMKQAIADIEFVLKEKVGQIGNQVFDPRRVTVATIQTLHKHKKDPKFFKWHKTLDVLFIDEVHTQVNKRNIDIITKIEPKAVFGLTATLQLKQKMTRMRVASLCGPLVYAYPLKQGTAEGYLTPGIVMGVDLERDHPLGFTYLERYNAMVVNSRKRNDLVEAIIREGVARGKYIICLVERVKHVRKMFTRLADLNVEAVFGEKKVAERMQSKKRFEKGKIQVIVANKVFKKGISIDRVDIIIDAASMKSKNDARQKYGRGVRLCETKKGLIYFDIGDRPKTSENMFKRATKSRRAAFRNEGIRVVSSVWSGDVEQLYDEAEEVLAKELKKHRRGTRES